MCLLADGCTNKGGSIKHKRSNKQQMFSLLYSSLCLFPFPRFLPTLEVFLVLPPLLLLQTFQPVPDIWIHYVYQKLLNKRASRLHKSWQPFHRVTRTSEINTAASLTHVWYKRRGTFTGAGVFTGSLAPPPRMKERIWLSEDKEANMFCLVLFEWFISDRMKSKI